MRKRLLAMLLSALLIISLMPVGTFAADAVGTWDVALKVSENNQVKYNNKSTVEVGFAVQSNDLKLRNLQSIVFAC